MAYLASSGIVIPNSPAHFQATQASLDVKCDECNNFSLDQIVVVKSKRLCRCICSGKHDGY